jgi:hypothetical protein
MRTNCRCCDYRTPGQERPSMKEVWVCTRGVSPNIIIENLDIVPDWCHRLIGCKRVDRPQPPVPQRSIAEWC